MIWNIVCRIGKEDQYEPPTGGAGETVYIATDGERGADAIRSHVNTVLHERGIRPPEAALDLLRLAMIVYSADRRIQRRRAYNGWERGFRVFLPVSDAKTWESVKATTERMLCFLTSDHWELEFREATAQPPVEAEVDREATPPDDIESVALLSGGLDSFSGAIDLLEGSDGLAAFVSHHGLGGVTHTVQNRVYQLLEDSYGDRFRPFRFFVQPRKSITGETEQSSRSRSILYLSLGVAVASGLGDRTPLHIFENGYMSLNVPLASNRIASLSTRTTHPHLIDLLHKVLAGLGLQVPLDNPYRFQTKGEMLERSRNADVLRRGIGLTLSCSNSTPKRFEGVSQYVHCGYCLPCIVRRAAVRKAGVLDTSEYYVDVTRNPRGKDLRALKAAIERAEIEGLPTLFDVLKAGPLPDSPREYADVHKRGLLELKEFVQASRGE